jgi:hypothetical protein
MKRIDVELTIKGQKKEHTFRTNDSGDYLFIGVGENKQISCESGFGDNQRTRKTIREYLRDVVYCGSIDPTEQFTRLTYKIHS